jgi:hypothetical protein
MLLRSPVTIYMKSPIIPILIKRPEAATVVDSRDPLCAVSNKALYGMVPPIRQPQYQMLFVGPTQHHGALCKIVLL